jgi:hypothetical protein
MDPDAIPLLTAAIWVLVFAGMLVLSWICFSSRAHGVHPDISFSVTVGPEFGKTPQAAQLERRFRWQIGVHSVIGLGLTLSSLSAMEVPGLFYSLAGVGLLWQMVGSTAAFALARRHVLPHALITSVGDGTPDSAWKLGLWYYNRDDPARSVASRFGSGRSYNWARPTAWVMVCGFVLLIGGFPLYFEVSSRVRSASLPQIVETVPLVGVSNVEPGPAEIRLRFDQPMDPEFCSLTRGRTPLPEITGDSRWIDEQTWAIPVRLAPKHRYLLKVNVDRDRGFRNRAGELAPPTEIEFRTVPTSRPATP